MAEQPPLKQKSYAALYKARIRYNLRMFSQQKMQEDWFPPAVFLATWCKLRSQVKILAQQSEASKLESVICLPSGKST